MHSGEKAVGGGTALSCQDPVGVTDNDNPAPLRAGMEEPGRLAGGAHLTQPGEATDGFLEEET